MRKSSSRRLLGLSCLVALSAVSILLSPGALHAARLTDADSARIIKELSLQGPRQAEVAASLTEESSNAEYVLGTLDVIAYGRKLYDPAAYRLSQEWRKSDASIDAAQFMQRLVLVQTAKSVLQSLLGVYGPLMIGMVDLADKVLRQVRWRLEEIASIAETRTCQPYRMIRETSPTLTPLEAWADMKDQLGAPIPAAPDAAQKLHFRCEFQYVAFALFARETEVKQQLRESVLRQPTKIGATSKASTGGSVPEADLAETESASMSVLRSLAGRWDGANSGGIRFTWTLDHSGHYTSEFRQAGKDVRGSGRVVVGREGALQWNSETSPQTGILTLSRDSSGRQVLQGTISGSRDSFRLIQIESRSPSHTGEDRGPTATAPRTSPDQSTEPFRLTINLEQLSIEDKIRLYIEGLRNDRFEHLFQLLGPYRSGLLGIMNSTPRVLWEEKISGYYNRELLKYRQAVPRGAWSSDVASVTKHYASLVRPATGWRMMEIRQGSMKSTAFVRVEFSDRATAPGLYALNGGTGTGPRVRVAWFEIDVDNGFGTIGNLAQREPLSFMEDVSELWK